MSGVRRRMIQSSCWSTHCREKATELVGGRLVEKIQRGAGRGVRTLFFIFFIKVQQWLLADSRLYYIHITRSSMRILFVILLLFCFVSRAEFKIPNPYKVLGIERDANEDQIKDGFKKRSKKYHPDRNKTDPKAKEKFEKIVNAYELLKDPERKRMYDLTGDEDPTAQQQQQHGFPGGFGFPGGGVNIQDLMRGGFFGGGHPGQGQQQQQQRRHTTYTFSFGGNQGMRFDF